MVKDKLEKHQFDAHMNDYSDITIDQARDKYNALVDSINTVRKEFNTKMETLYYNYIRKDPFRSIYNY